MTGKRIKKVTFNGKVFHDLGRQFHEVPVYISTAQTSISRISEHTMEAVAEFMKESCHFTESQQSRFILCRFGEIHYDRYVWAAVFTGLFVNPLPFIFRHPCTGAFTVPWMKVRIEYC